MDVALLWASPEHGLLLQEYQDLEAAGTTGGFLGISVPNLLVNKRTLVTRPGLAPFTTNITRIPLQVSRVSVMMLTKISHEFVRVTTQTKMCAVCSIMPA